MKVVYALILIFIMQSCSKDYLDTSPTNAVTFNQIYASTSDIQSSLVGAYSSLYSFGVGGYTGHDNYGQKSFDLQNDLMGSDMVIHAAGYGWYNRTYQYISWGQATKNSQSDVAWIRYYKLIGQMNDILSSLPTAKGSNTEKASLRGQALGIRAYCNYYLINYFQQTYKGNENKLGVPIETVESFGNKPRGTVQPVYDQIVADLKEAENLLTGVSFGDKTAFDVHVVQGFRARAALIMNDWATAASYANKAYNYGGSPQLMNNTQYKDGFSRISNPEWMWGSYIPATNATIYASFFSHLDPKTNGYASLGQFKKITKDLYDKIPTGDVRKSIFQKPGTGTTTSPDYSQLKFKVPSPGSFAADYVYMRTAEMYLIEAEALARQGNDPAARTSLETLIKTRYPAYSAGSFSGQSLIDEILLQRRIELWGEGFSLIDIKRTNRGLNRPTGAGNHGNPNLDPVVYILPDASPRFLMRIPQRELDANPFMTPADQNP